MIYLVSVFAAIAIATFMAYYTFSCRQRTQIQYGNVLQTRKDLEIVDMKFAQCEQQLKLIEVELAKLQDELNTKKNKNLASCVSSLAAKIETWKRFYRAVHNIAPTDAQVAELKNRIGIVPTTNPNDTQYNVRNTTIKQQ
jgi:hypothetical protein